jgi:hypothetical protein
MIEGIHRFGDFDHIGDFTLLLMGCVLTKFGEFSLKIDLALFSRLFRSENLLNFSVLKPPWFRNQNHFISFKGMHFANT